METADCHTFVRSSRDSERGRRTLAPTAPEGSGAPVRPGASLRLRRPPGFPLPRGVAGPVSAPVSPTGQSSLRGVHSMAPSPRTACGWHGAIRTGCRVPRCHVTRGASSTPLKFSWECTMGAYSLSTLGTEPLSMSLQRRGGSKGT